MIVLLLVDIVTTVMYSLRSAIVHSRRRRSKSDVGRSTTAFLALSITVRPATLRHGLQTQPSRSTDTALAVYRHSPRGLQTQPSRSTDTVLAVYRHSPRGLQTQSSRSTDTALAVYRHSPRGLQTQPSRSTDTVLAVYRHSPRGLQTQSSRSTDTVLGVWVIVFTRQIDCSFDHGREIKYNNKVSCMNQKKIIKHQREGGYAKDKRFVMTT